MEKLTEEKKNLLAKYEQMLSDAKENNDEKMKIIISSKDEQISAIKGQHLSELENQRVLFEKELNDFQEKFKNSKMQESDQVKKVNERLLFEKNQEVEKFSELYQDSVKEIERLNNLLNEQKSSQVMTSSEVGLLEGKLSELKKLLKQAEGGLALSKHEVKSLQVCAHFLDLG